MTEGSNAEIAISTPARSTRSHDPIAPRVTEALSSVRQSPSSTQAIRRTPPTRMATQTSNDQAQDQPETPSQRNVRSPHRPARVSPYPQRTPPPVIHESIPDEQIQQPRQARGRGRTQASVAHHLQLIVQPLVKSSINQRDTSGESLDDFVVAGSTFSEMIRVLWDKYSPRIKGRAIKTDGVWSLVASSFEEWSRLMQFRRKREVIDPSKNEYQWNQWLVQNRGKSIKLVVFEYGTAVVRAQDLEAFLVACVRPQLTDRAGAVAEDPLQDIVSRLQTRWATTFRGEVSVWRMWANNIARTLDRSLWDDLINETPPGCVAPLLRPADLPSERQVSQITRSVSVALECVNASIEDCADFREAWKSFGQRIDQYERSLARRKRIIVAMMEDVALPPVDSVPDPLSRMENINDAEHEE